MHADCMLTSSTKLRSSFALTFKQREDLLWHPVSAMPGHRVVCASANGVLPYLLYRSEAPFVIIRTRLAPVRDARDVGVSEPAMNRALDIFYKIPRLP